MHMATSTYCCYYSAAVESTGQPKAEAQSLAEAAKIEEAAVEQAKLKAEASKIESVAVGTSFSNSNFIIILKHFIT